MLTHSQVLVSKNIQYITPAALYSKYNLLFLSFGFGLTFTRVDPTCGVCTGFSHILHNCDPAGTILAVSVAEDTQIYSILIIDTVKQFQKG